jgi:hypothetical protein
VSRHLKVMGHPATATRRHGRRSLTALLATGLVLAGLAGCTRFGASLTRPSDPVVLDGSALPKLLGTDPMHVVGFSWDGSAWHQVPVQVDKRDYVSPGAIYHLPTSSYPNLYGTTTPYKILVYTPPATLSPGYTSASTYTPPDSNPMLDANDEVSFLAADTGKQAAPSVVNPAGVNGRTRQEVKATDPLDASQFGYLYLFHSAKLTGGGAGTDGVHYNFSLDSGSYTATYKMGSNSLAPNNTWGYNPEHSTVLTPSYGLKLGDRWLNNGLDITQSGATGVNFLERTHYYVTVGCGRTEDTFDGGASNPGEGAFVVNISGPVRAIRSYIGANSYLYTVNTDIYYPGRQDTVTEVRGHAGLPGYGSADDFVTGTSGLKYSDPLNSGVVIDGTPDTVTPITYTTGGTVPATWQMVSGAQGSLVTVRVLDTDITGLKVATVYEDRNPASPPQCTGDAAAWGQNGMNVTSPVGSVPVTDPTLTAAPATLVLHRYRYLLAPNLPPATAATVDAQARNPIQTTVSG